MNGESNKDREDLWEAVVLERFTLYEPTSNPKFRSSLTPKCIGLSVINLSIWDNGVNPAYNFNYSFYTQELLAWFTSIRSSISKLENGQKVSFVTSKFKKINDPSSKITGGLDIGVNDNGVMYLRLHDGIKTPVCFHFGKFEQTEMSDYNPSTYSKISTIVWFDAMLEAAGRVNDSLAVNKRQDLNAILNTSQNTNSF